MKKAILSLVVLGLVLIVNAPAEAKSLKDCLKDVAHVVLVPAQVVVNVTKTVAQKATDLMTKASTAVSNASAATDTSAPAN